MCELRRLSDKVCVKRRKKLIGPVDLTSPILCYCLSTHLRNQQPESTLNAVRLCQSPNQPGLATNNPTNRITHHLVQYGLM